MNFRLKRWLWYVFCLTIVLILCWQSSTSSERLNNTARDIVLAIASFFGVNIETANLYTIIRKIGHGAAFCTLSLLGHLAISGDADNFRTTIAWSFILNFGLALLTEILQACAINRCPTFRDALINLSGSAIGVLFAIFIELISSKQKCAQHLHEAT